LTLRPQLAVFLQNYPFASARILAQHFLMGVPTIKKSVQRELGLKNFARRWVPYFLSPAQKVARVEASTEMLRILHESEESIVKKAQQVTTLDSNIPIRPQKILHDRRQILFQECGRPSGRSKS
jgi:hypothetical protein